MLSNLLKLMLLVFVVLVLQMCGKKSEEPAAVVGGRVITLAEFEERFAAGKAPNVLKASTDSMKMELLNQMINDQLMVVDAYQKKMDQDSSIQKRIESSLKNSVATKVWNTDVSSFIVPEAEIKELYEKKQKEVKVRDLVMRFAKNDSVDTETDIKEMIDQIYKYLNSGAEFDSLARRYSQDRLTAAKGGDRGFLRWNANVSNDEVFQQAFKMDKGELSRPFKVGKEYHIVLVEDVRAVPVERYEVEKQRIVNQLMQMRGKEIQERQDVVYKSLLEKYDGKMIEENLKLLVTGITKIDPVADSIRKANHLRGDQFSYIPAEDTAKALYTYSGDRKVTIGTIINFMRGIDPAQRPRINSETDLKQIVERMMVYEIFAMEGKNRGYAKDDEIVASITKGKESMMLKMYKFQEIREKVNPTDDDVAQYYEEHKAQYVHPERRDVQEIWCTNNKIAEAALKEVKAGKNFTTVANKYNERVATKKKSGRLDLIIEQQYGSVGKEAFKMKKGEVSGLIKMGQNYSIIKILDILPPTEKTFDEVKFQVKNEVRKHQTTQREKDLIQKLTEEIPVKVYSERISNSFKELTD
jgi:parvulin-like peptidyl-prolyl isomerase